MVFTDDFGATARSNEVTIDFIDTPEVVLNNNRDYPMRSLLLSAEATAGAAPSIRLHWPENPHPANYILSRKNPNETEWHYLANLAGTPTEYTDTTVKAGATYDYRVERVYADVDPYPLENRLSAGYVRAGIEAPLVEQRGQVLLLVDETVEAALRSEIDRFKQDLIGDGWAGVIEHSVPRHIDAYSSTRDTSPDPRYKERVQAVKSRIEDEYAQLRGRLQSVVLLGRVPIPYSGHSAPGCAF